METRTNRKSAVAITVLLILAVMSLLSRVEKLSLRRRLLSVVEKEVYPSKVTPWKAGSSIARRLQAPDPRSMVDKIVYPERVAPWKEGNPSRDATVVPAASYDPSDMPFKLPQSAAEWCMPPSLPRLPYYQCNGSQAVNRVPLFGGLTNALKMLLLGTILSFEQNACFFVDESTSALPKRKDPANEFKTSFLDRYFEPIGVSPKDPLVEAAVAKGTTNIVDWRESWEWTHNRRIKNQKDDIEALGYHGIEGHELKRTMLKRMWRPLPLIRQHTCSQLEQHVGPQEFMAFSVRRGDKSTENFVFATPNQYIDAAEKAIKSQFDENVPIIFVATDDCTVIDDFKSLRPSWRFVSECGAANGEDDGFRLQDMKDWSHTDTDAHFSKFFVELYAMATAKYFIGVIYTNVTWWALFMRSQDPSTFEILVTPGTERREGIAYW